MTRLDHPSRRVFSFWRPAGTASIAVAQPIAAGRA